MLLLPAFHLPLANLTFNLTCKLPGGRNSAFHHAFPILSSPPPSGVVQASGALHACVAEEGASPPITLQHN